MGAFSRPGGGPAAGFIAIPEVGDEVLVAFEYGDFNFPVIIGGLWNGKHAIPDATAGAAAGEKPLIRSWQSINGHSIAMYDNADKKIEILTTDGHTILIDDANKKLEIATSGGHTATFDDQSKTVEIKSSGGHKITMDDNGRKITVESSGDLEVKAAMNMKLQAGMNLDLQGGTAVTIKGALVKIN
ncbi:MAG: phage baseplate assembly protein V [Chloroflexi bacterium]|nr:phage baseplate assembly protein V [Chloroflexota bacterium]